MRLPGAVLRRAPRAGRRGGRRRRSRSSTSGAATRRSGRRRTSSRRCSRPPAGTTSTATRPSAGSRGCARRSPRATATATASSSTRSARSPSSRARRRRSSSSLSRSPSAATRSSCPTRTTPTTRPASRSRAPSSARFPLDPAAGWQPDLDGRPAGGGALPQLPVEPVRGLRGARASSPPPSTTRDAHRAAIVHDAAYIDLVFDGRRPESFLATPGREGGRRRALVDVEELRHGRLADRLRASETPRSSSGINTIGDHSRVGIFAPLQDAAIAALDGPQDERRGAPRDL